MRLEFKEAVWAHGKICGLFISEKAGDTISTEDYTVVPEAVIRYRLAGGLPPPFPKWIDNTVSEAAMMNALIACREMREEICRNREQENHSPNRDMNPG